MGNNGEIRVFAGSSGLPFAIKMCELLGAEVGESEVKQFAEGNTYVKICETVRGRDAYLVQSIGLHPNDEFVEILFWMDAFKRASGDSITAIIPYFGYAKGDKKDEPRVSIRARVCAECIELAGADRVVTMDLHSPQIQGFFKRPVDHLFAMPVLCAYVKSLNIEDLVVVSPDAGFAKRAHKFAKHLDTPLAIGDKTRVGPDERAKILGIIGDVKDKNVLIVDDFSITGGTLIEVAQGLEAMGAKKIMAALSHILLDEESVEAIEKSPIELLVSTDSVDNPHLIDSHKIDIVSGAPLFAEAVQRIHNRESVSPLFDVVPPNIEREVVRSTRRHG